MSRSEIEKAVREVAVRYPLKSVIFWGSYAQGTVSAESDVDLLVVFEKSAISLLTINNLKYDLEDRLGRPVDIIHAPLTDDAMIETGKTVMLLGA